MTATAVPTRPYVARREQDGTYTICDVEVFGTVAQGAHGGNPEVDLPFLHACLRRYQRREDEGYSPPLHIQHHGSGEAVERAGAFRLKTIRHVRYEGRIMPVLVADFTRVPESVFQRIAAGELPYRSVEVSYRDPEIQSIALLSHDAPFFKFRDLVVSLDARGMAGFHAEGDDLGLFAFRTYQEATVDETEKKGDEMEAAPAPDITAMVDGIVATVMAQVESMISEKIAAAVAAASGVKEEEPAAAEGEMACDEEKKDGDFSAAEPDKDVALAHLEGRFAALEAQFAEQRARAERTAKADAKVAEFRERGYTVSDAHVAKFREVAERGEAALEAYAEGFAERAPDPDATLDDFGARHAPADDAVVTKFAARGPEALSAARSASAAYEAQRRYLGCSREAFIESTVELALRGGKE